MYILVVISLISYSLQQKLKCADKLKINTCELEGYEGDEEVTYVKACSKNKVCEIINDVGTCVKPTKKKKEGDKCYSSVECEVGLCSDGKCKSKKAGEGCKENNDCSLNLFCKGEVEESKTCASLAGKDEACSEDEDCQIGLVCNYSYDGKEDQKCIELFSKEDGEVG